MQVHLIREMVQNSVIKQISLHLKSVCIFYVVAIPSLMNIICA